MDYKEKYEQALEVAQRFCNNSVAITKKGLEDIFPELKESIDERIKKVIKQVLSESTTEKDECYLDNGVTQQEVFAWIESQGEQPKKHDVCDNCDQQGCCVSPCPMKLVEKHGGQESAAWSEEDELHLRELESLVKQVWAIAEHENDKDTIHKMSDLSFFLKTLKPQLKQEWSKEDEDIKETIIGELELVKKSVGEINYNGYDKLIDWLKSLRPQNTWKPSDEQMEALEKVTNYSAFHDAKYCVELKRLLGQLKAL